MTKHFCDRCGAEFVNDHDAFVIGTMSRTPGLGVDRYDAVRHETYRPTAGYEVCGSCKRSFSEWMVKDVPAHG